MRHSTIPRTLAAALLFAASASAAPPVPAAVPEPTVTLTFLATSDIHGHVESEHATLHLDGGKAFEVERGGLSLLGGYLAIARKAHPGKVVLVDAGDMMQGTLISNLGEGSAVVKAMNALHYDAAAVGNHEFDFGPVGPRSVPGAPGDDPRGALKARAAEAKFPWLTANVTGEKGGPLGKNVKPWTMVTVDGVKVGIVGGTSEDTPRTTHKGNLGGLTVSPLAPSVTKAAAEARAAGATVVIAVVHEGGECKKFDAPLDLSSCKADAEVWRLARALPPGAVDAIFGGHTHQGVAHVVSGIPVLQPFALARAFSRLDLTIDKKTGHVVPGGAHVFPPTEICAQVADRTGSCDERRAHGTKLVPATFEGAEVVADKTIPAAYAADLASAAAKRAEVVGVVLDAPLHRRYREESALGDLAADAFRHAKKTDLGLMNGGGLRGDLPAGELRFGALFEAFPFDDRVVTIRIPGYALRDLLARNLAHDRGVLSISGATVQARCDLDAVTVDVHLEGGTPFSERAQYTVATTDFLASGGDDFGRVLADLPTKAPSSTATSTSGGTAVPTNAADDGPTLRDAIGDELRRRGPRIEGDRALFDPAHPRLSLPGPRPLRCVAGTLTNSPVNPGEHHAE